MADSFGAYMRQFKPNRHLVTTSFWHSFPKEEFWANPNYPNVDYADIHQYIPEDDPNFNDTARSTYNLSMSLAGTGKPVMRGETGLLAAAGGPTDRLQTDTNGVWLHNLLWAGLNPGAMIESYWYESQHIYNQDGRDVFDSDLRPVYRAYYNFASRLPLNNGKYRDAAATSSNTGIVAWGQKDLTNGRAHLWVWNTQYTWRNVVNGKILPALSAQITLKGFQPGRAYTFQWWSTTQTDVNLQVISSGTVTARSDGSIVLSVSNLRKDIALQLFPVKITSPVPEPGSATQSVYLPLISAVPDQQQHPELEGQVPDFLVPDQDELPEAQQQVPPVQEPEPDPEQLAEMQSQQPDAPAPEPAP
jgi:hypothetical protein